MSDGSTKSLIGPTLRTGLIVTAGFAVAAVVGAANPLAFVVVLLVTGFIAGSRPGPHAPGLAVGALVGGVVLDVTWSITSARVVGATTPVLAELAFAVGLAALLTFALVLPGYLLTRAFLTKTAADADRHEAEGASPGLLAGSALGILALDIGVVV
jgi:hypothetical protein